MVHMAVAPEAVDTNRYYPVRAAAGLEPKVGWYLMLLVGVFLGLDAEFAALWRLLYIHGSSSLEMALWQQPDEAL